MNQYFKVITLFLSLIIMIGTGCKEKEAENALNQATIQNEILDTKAADLVSKMEIAMGGQKKWEDLNYVSWTFFGSRHLLWDKKGGRVRIDSPRDTSVYLVDLNNLKGKVIKGGMEVTDPEQLDELIQRGKSIWINDSYWLFMPFKLRDPGVSVNYMREDTMIGGVSASVLEMTFDNVGNTPENKYEVYIDKKDNLIKQWAFFKEANQETPPRIWPWDNYQSFGGLMLSTDRTDKSGPSNVRVYDEIDNSVFDSFEAFEYF